MHRADKIFFLVGIAMMKEMGRHPSQRAARHGPSPQKGQQKLPQTAGAKAAMAKIAVKPGGDAKPAKEGKKEKAKQSGMAVAKPKHADCAQVQEGNSRNRK